mmetsp:Transcript_11052/g.20645  ORF Transcript_11052/g.20645 Transcript_11052/m.20645 type:complete len:109 (-) Transcript_11052:22-348(-)
MKKTHQLSLKVQVAQQKGWTDAEDSSFFICTQSITRTLVLLFLSLNNSKCSLSQESRSTTWQMKQVEEAMMKQRFNTGPIALCFVLYLSVCIFYLSSFVQVFFCNRSS